MPPPLHQVRDFKRPRFLPSGELCFLAEGVRRAKDSLWCRAKGNFRFFSSVLADAFRVYLTPAAPPYHFFFHHFPDL